MCASILYFSFPLFLFFFVNIFCKWGEANLFEMAMGNRGFNTLPFPTIPIQITHPSVLFRLGSK